MEMRVRKTSHGPVIRPVLRIAVLACMLGAAMTVTSLGAQPWTMENGQYVDAAGAPIAGALAMGITVTKYQNRANAENGIDWAKAAADGVSFAMIRVGYYRDKDPYFCLLYTSDAADE